MTSNNKIIGNHFEGELCELLQKQDGGRTIWLKTRLDNLPM